MQLAVVEGVEDAGLVGRCGGEDGVEFVESLADLRRGEFGDADGGECRVGGRGASGGRRGCVAGWSAIARGRWGSSGGGSVAGGVVVEVVGVAPGGEGGDFVVPYLFAGRVAGAFAEPPGEPVGLVAGEAVDDLAGAMVDGGGDDDGFVGVDAVVGELAVPDGFVFADCPLHQVEVADGVGGELGGVRVVDRFDLPPVQALGCLPAVGGDEVDVGGAGEVDDGGDGADVVPVQRPHPCPVVEEAAVGAGGVEALPFDGRVAMSGGFEPANNLGDVPLPGLQLGERGGVGEVGDAGEVGGDGGGEQLGLGVFEGVEQVGAGVVVGFRREPDAGGVGAFADGGGVLAGGVQPGAVAGSGQGDVAGLAVQAAWPDDEHFVAGDALGLVDGDGVAVVDVAVADVVAVER